MTVDQEELLANFESLLGRRNAVGLRLGALLISLLFPLFWILDWVVMRDWVSLTFWLRLAGTLYGLGVWIATFRFTDWIYRRANLVGISLGVMIGWLIAIMAWMDDGYESPYYAGLNLVILGASFLFSWPLRLSIGFNALLYGFYMAPLLLNPMSIDDIGVAITNQFFLISTILITIIAQHHRLEQERKDYVGMQTQRLLLEEAEIMAATDPLTGLYNRRHFFSLGAHEVQHAHHLKHPLSLLAVDIDHFKHINDLYGHPIGDDVLRAVAQTLHTSLRQGDILTRLGGDEFVALLPAADVNEATLISERVSGVVQGLSIHTTDMPPCITISIGIAQLTDDIHELDTLLRRADQALYEAKRAGRAQIQIWKPNN